MHTHTQTHTHTLYIYIYGTPPQDLPISQEYWYLRKICYFWYVILHSGIWGMLYSVSTYIYIYIEDSRFKIQDSWGLFPANLESNPCGNLGSWILNLAKNAFRMHSFGRIQDSRFKISGDSLGQILNPDSRFKIQDFWGLFGANLESTPWIQDSRFKISGNSLGQILNPDSRFAPKIPRTLWNLESWILPKECILNPDSLPQRVPSNLESWRCIQCILWLDSRFAEKSPQESWILNPLSLSIYIYMYIHYIASPRHKHISTSLVPLSLCVISIGFFFSIYHFL